MSRSIQTDEPSTRIVFMGGAMVGKSAIIKRFINNTFESNYVQTVEDMYRTSFQGCQLDLLDTAGCYHFPAMRDYAIRTGDVFVLVFAWHDEPSFDYVRSLVDRIREIKQTKSNIIVVANKTDLEKTTRKLIETDMVVSIDWDCIFHECSAKSSSNVDQLFENIVRTVLGEKDPVKTSVGTLKRALRSVFKKRKNLENKRTI